MLLLMRRSMADWPLRKWSSSRKSRSTRALIRTREFRRSKVCCLAESYVWMRADNTYYKGEFAEYCRTQGWDCSVIVTNGNCKLPVVIAVRDMDDTQWDWLNDEEQAI